MYKVIFVDSNRLEVELNKLVEKYQIVGIYPEPVNLLNHSINTRFVIIVKQFDFQGF